MILNPEDRRAIIDYRIERAYNTFKEAEYVASGKFWNLCANRLYYSVFYICEALLLSNKISANTHAGVSRMIHLHFVKNKILTTDEGDLLSRLFRMRQTGDYDDLSNWQEYEIIPMFAPVKELILKIHSLIEQC